jgi:hypothetical protein
MQHISEGDSEVFGIFTCNTHATRSVEINFND